MRDEGGRIEWRLNPAAQSNSAATIAIEVILLTAFPNTDDRTDSQSDYFDSNGPLTKLRKDDYNHTNS